MANMSVDARATIRSIVRKAAVFPLLLMLTGAAAQAQDWPQFRGPTGQGHSTERGVPLEWSESRNVVWKTPVPGRGWSSPVVSGGRVWLTTAVEADGDSLRALAFDVETGREVVNVEVFRLRSVELSELPRTAAPPRRRSSTAIVSTSTSAPTAPPRSRRSGEIVWKARFPYESQHGNGGSPIALRRPADLQLRRQRRCVRGGPRQAHRQGPLENAAGANPAIRRIPRRSSSASAIATRSSASARIARRPTIRRPARKSGVSATRDGFSNVPRPVFGHGLVYIATGFQEPSLHRRARRRHGRRDQDARRLDPAALGAADAVAAARRRRDLSRQRRRHRVLPQREDRRAALAPAAERQLLRVTRLCRRADLFPERGRRRHGHRAGHGVPRAGDEHARRRDAGLDGGVGRVDLHSLEQPPLSDCHRTMTGEWRQGWKDASFNRS